MNTLRILCEYPTRKNTEIYRYAAPNTIKVKKIHFSSFFLHYSKKSANFAGYFGFLDKSTISIN